MSEPFQHMTGLTALQSVDGCPSHASDELRTVEFVKVIRYNAGLMNVPFAKWKSNALITHLKQILKAARNHTAAADDCNSSS